MITNKLRIALGVLSLVMLAPVAVAQQPRDFQGNWKGDLTMDVLFGVPEEHVARLTKPVEFEMRIFSRGTVELYFRSDEDEWIFTTQRSNEWRVTPVNQTNAVFLARVPSARKWQNNFAFNMAKLDDETMLVTWSRLSTRDELEYDGLDSIGMSGSAILKND